MSQVRSSKETMYSAKYQMICWPRYRRRVLVGAVSEPGGDRLEVVAEHRGKVIGMEVMPDHVHVLVGVPPVVPLPRLVELLKGRSSRRLRQEFARLRRLPAW